MGRYVDKCFGLSWPCDAANIQFRILAHYLKNDELIDQIVNKGYALLLTNVWTESKDKEYDSSDHDLVAGRKKGKTCTFAIIMGAGVGKIGQILGSAEKG